ncbi:MAG: DNA polymerase III subunit [Cryobacterium sp.]|nr:DNA polymerase III subunit [Oligoflexia bacterium]
MSTKKSSKSSKLDSPLPIDPELLEAHRHPVLDALDHWKENGKIPPVLMLSGPRGCGKRDIAFFIAQTLQCENSGLSDSPPSLFGGSVDPGVGRPRPCGECGPCLRNLSGQSLDFKEITLAADSSTLKIDQFREMKETMGFSSFDGSYRIFLITDAEKMTVQAANSLLKLLEEPPEGWIFLLTVSDPALLPSTVVSRCQILRLRPLPESVLRPMLERREIPADRIEIATLLGEGSLSRALEIAEDEAWEMRSTLMRFLVLPQSVFHELIDYAASDSANFRMMLDSFELILNDLVIHAKEPAASFRNFDAKSVITEHQKLCVLRKGGLDAAQAFWIERAERLFRMRREITVPLNQKVLATDFLSPWLDAV